MDRIFIKILHGYLIFLCLQIRRAMATSRIPIPPLLEYVVTSRLTHSWVYFFVDIRMLLMNVYMYFVDAGSRQHKGETLATFVRKCNHTIQSNCAHSSIKPASQARPSSHHISLEIIICFFLYIYFVVSQIFIFIFGNNISYLWCMNVISKYSSNSSQR